MKKIGIDISPLQGPHRMRGIGYVTQRVINHLPKDKLGDNELVLFFNREPDESIDKVIKELNIQDVRYSLREIPTIHKNIFEKKLPGRLALIPKAYVKLTTYFQYRLGTNTFGKTRDIDTFVQFDQSAPLPRKIKRGGKTVLVIYDIIPYKLESDYLWGYRTARRRGLNRKASIKCLVRRSLYKSHLKANARHATKLVSISESTSSDFVNHIGIPRNKVRTLTLGADSQTPNSAAFNKSITLDRYHDTSWGYLSRKYTLSSDSRYLLFVGGADHRRKLEDLVAAFNQLRARGENILLVLSGDSMQGPNAISNGAVRKSLLETAYPDDIIYVGFADDKTRDWLYKHACALVFPSVYEGFGLPVLEAMGYGTPVISYDNLATKEVAKDGPVYANDSTSLFEQIIFVLSMTQDSKKKMLENSLNISKRYSWKSTGHQFLEIIEPL